MTSIVVLPGLDGSGELRASFAQALGDGFDVRCVSYPAHGVDTYAAAQAVAAAQLPVSGRYVLVGESFSGPVACALAGARLPNLAGLVLCASFARYPLPQLAALIPLFRALPPRALFAPPLAAFMLGTWSTPERIAALHAAVARLDAATIRARLRAAARADALPALRATEVPVLCLQATRDRVVPASAATEILANARTARLLAVDGPHSLLQARPDDCAAAIGQFARQVCG
jgi:pimeloyl-[acyl-carrier protein] methyl ester esterase